MLILAAGCGYRTRSDMEVEAGWLAQYLQQTPQRSLGVSCLARGSIMDVRAHADIAPADQVGRQGKKYEIIIYRT